jgi:hypothetical protein
MVSVPPVTGWTDLDPVAPWPSKKQGILAGQALDGGERATAGRYPTRRPWRGAPPTRRGAYLDARQATGAAAVTVKKDHEKAVLRGLNPSGPSNEDPATMALDYPSDAIAGRHGQGAATTVQLFGVWVRAFPGCSTTDLAARFGVAADEPFGVSLRRHARSAGVRQDAGGRWWPDAIFVEP